VVISGTKTKSSPPHANQDHGNWMEQATRCLGLVDWFTPTACRSLSFQLLLTCGLWPHPITMEAQEPDLMNTSPHSLVKITLHFDNYPSGVGLLPSQESSTLGSQSIKCTPYPSSPICKSKNHLQSNSQPEAN